MRPHREQDLHPCVAGCLEILPTGDVSNPYRVTYVAAEKGFRGDVVPFHAQKFDYALAPHVRTTEATKISLAVRTDGDLVPYEPIVLSGVKDGVSQALVLHVDPPAKGRMARWQWKVDGKIVREEPLKESVGPNWVEVVADHWHGQLCHYARSRTAGLPSADAFQFG